VDHLLHHDTYLLLADYRAYVDAQSQADFTFRDTRRWTRMSILNSARGGMFSSDRSMREYCDGIWHVEPTPIELSQPVPPALRH
jgi:starch phosphorylase